MLRQLKSAKIIKDYKDVYFNYKNIEIKLNIGLSDRARIYKESNWLIILATNFNLNYCSMVILDSKTLELKQDIYLSNGDIQENLDTKRKNFLDRSDKYIINELWNYADI